MGKGRREDMNKERGTTAGEKKYEENVNGEITVRRKELRLHGRKTGIQSRWLSRGEAMLGMTEGGKPTLK